MRMLPTARRQRIDEKSQVTQYHYNPDNTVSGISYSNASVSTPPVTTTYDPSYPRISSMTDGSGTTLYTYAPITGVPSLGAGQIAECGWSVAQ